MEATMSREPTARVVRAAWLAALAGCVTTARGAPTAMSAAGVAIAIAVVGAASLALPEGERRRRLPKTLLGAFVAALVVAAAAFATGHVRPLQKPWITLFGIPLAIAASAFDGPLVPRRRPLALLWIVSLAIGVVSAEPWATPTAALFFAIAAAVGVADAAFSTARAARLAEVAPPRHALRRALLLSAVAALLVVGGAYATLESLRPVPRLLHEPESKPTAPPDLLERENPEPAPTRARDLGMALVRAEVAEGEAPALPRPLYLRRRVLDEVRNEGGFVRLAARSGAAGEIADDADGHVDRRIPWRDADPRATEQEALLFQVTILDEAQAELLLVTGTQWLEGDRIAVAADGSVRLPDRRSGVLTYHDAASPARAFARLDPPTTRRADPAAGALPDGFDGRELLRGFLRRATEGAQSDFERAARIADFLRQEGELDPFRQCSRWIDFLGGPRPSGRPIHFAQAAALLARLAGLPARVVLGYRVDDFEPEHRTWQVRSSQSWPWVEIAFEGAGWIEFDPTPERLAPPRDGRAGGRAGLAANDVGLAGEVSQTAAQTRPWWIGLGLLVAVACFLLFPNVQMRATRIGMRRMPAGVSGPARRAWRFWQELIDLCQRFDLRASAALTATEFAAQVILAAPSESDAISGLLGVYHRCRFGGGDLAGDEERRAKALLARLPQSLSRRREQERARLRNRR
jgi:transglutaminase-like putative cysteine protease